MRSADPARLGAALAVLWAAHDFADHVGGQTDHQAAHKADPGPAGWRALAGHVGLYHLVQVAAVGLLRTAGVRPSWRRTAAAVAVSASTHAVLDRHWPVRWVLEHTGSPGFAASAKTPTLLADVRRRVRQIEGQPERLVAEVPSIPLPLHGPYLADQALHHVAIAAAAWILAGGAR